MTLARWLVLRAVGEERYDDLEIQSLPTEATDAVDDFLSTLDSATPTGDRFLLCPQAGDSVEAQDL